MRNLLRLATAAALAASSTAQTWSKCNPLQGTCPPDTALGMAVDIDFRNGPVNSFAASGSPTYDKSSGVSFTVARGGDAPQLASLFYIMFGRVEITMKAAPGAGIVSSLVLESDDLDEIDIEWLGSDPDEIQSNYFGKGQTTTYNRGQFHDVKGTQAGWITYTIDWTKDRVVWMAGGKVLRTLTVADAAANQYPQTPMQVKFGSWAGGDPATNAPGTVQWARGPTDFSKGPFTMAVQSIAISDYSTGKQYRYSDTTGSWQSIEAVGGKVNANEGKAGGAVTPTATAPAGGSQPAATSAGFISVPVGGIAKDGSSATATQTGWPWVASASPGAGSIPSGWYMRPDGKIARDSSSPAARTAVPALLLALVVPFAVGVVAFTQRL